MPATCLMRGNTPTACLPHTNVHMLPRADCISKRMSTACPSEFTVFLPCACHVCTACLPHIHCTSAACPNACLLHVQMHAYRMSRHMCNACPRMLCRMLASGLRALRSTLHRNNPMWKEPRRNSRFSFHTALSPASPPARTHAHTRTHVHARARARTRTHALVHTHVYRAMPRQCPRISP